jgi:membrane fusion protein (multidrug efflux system)
MSNGHENDDDRPDEYRYRYKYLYKYGDDQPSSGKEDDKKKDKQDDDKDGEDQKGKDDKDSKNDKEKKDGGQKKDGEDDRKKKRKRILVMAIIAGVFVLAALTWLLLYIFIFSQRETTDDAYLHGDLVTISPRVPGTVVEIAVEETEFVHAGQVLVRLDPADAQVSLMNAQGQLAQAVRNAQQSIQQAAEADAVVAQRRAQYLTQRDEYDRRFPLVDVHAVAREEASNAERQMPRPRMHWSTARMCGPFPR